MLVGKRAPVDLLRQPAPAGMTGDKAHLLGLAALCERDAQARGQGQSRRDARHDFDRDAATT